jgi:hypothetical protein
MALTWQGCSIAAVFVVAGVACTVGVSVVVATTLITKQKQTCALARTRAAAGVLPLLFWPPKSGAQVTIATDGVQVYGMAEDVTMVLKNKMLVYLHGQVDRLQCVCSVSSSVHNNCDKRAQLLYMCVSMFVLVARKAWLRIQERRAGVVMIRIGATGRLGHPDSVGQL